MIRNLRLAPDAVVILDYARVRFQPGQELCILRDRYPCSGWMLFSETLVGSLLHCSLRGERPFGVVLKRCDSDEIEAAFEAVMQGRGYVCESIRDTPAYPEQSGMGWDVCGHRIVRDAHPVVSMPSVHSLTPTEQAVLREIALGRTTREIAADRYVSFHTVITHRKNIFRKLGVNNVHEATKYAMRAGIIDVAEYCI
ncbi:MAG: response regulator transcription factor [Alistipes indistinctus]